MAGRYSHRGPDRHIPESPIIPHQTVYWSPSPQASSPPPPPMPRATPSPVSSSATPVSGRSTTPVTPLSHSDPRFFPTPSPPLQDDGQGRFTNTFSQRFSHMGRIEEGGPSSSSPMSPSNPFQTPSLSSDTYSDTYSPGPLTLVAPPVAHTHYSNLPEVYQEPPQVVGLLTPTAPNQRLSTGRPWTSSWARLIGRPRDTSLTSPSVGASGAASADAGKRMSRFSFRPKSFASKRETSATVPMILCTDGTIPIGNSPIGNSPISSSTMSGTPRAPSILGRIEEKGGWGLEVPVVDAPEVIHHDTGKEVAYPMAPPRYESRLFLDRPRIIPPWYRRRRYIALMILVAGIVIGGVVTAILLTQLNKHDDNSSSGSDADGDGDPDTGSDPSVGVTESLTGVLSNSQLSATNWTSGGLSHHAVAYQDNSSAIFVSYRSSASNTWVAVNVTERAIASISKWDVVRARPGGGITIAANPSSDTFEFKLYYITANSTLYDLATDDETFQTWSVGDVGSQELAAAPSTRLTNVWQWAFWNETMPTPYHAVYMQTPDDASIHAVYPINGEWAVREATCDGGVNGIGFATCPFVDNRQMDLLTVAAGFTNQRLYYNHLGNLVETAPLGQSNTWNPTGASLEPERGLAEASQMQCVQYSLSSVVVPVLLSSTWLRLHMWTVSTSKWASRDVALNGPGSTVYRGIAANQDMRAFVLDSNMRISEYSIPRGSFWDWQFQSFVDTP